MQIRVTGQPHISRTGPATLAAAVARMSNGEPRGGAVRGLTFSLDGHAPVVPPAYLEPLPASRRLQRSEAGLLLDTAARACAEASALGTRLAVISAHRLRSRTAFQRLGYRSDADYAREELRITPRAFRDLARLGARLEALPAVRKAFLDGEITRSQAEVIGRIATPADEAAWLARAAKETVRGLKAAARRAEKSKEDDSAATPSPHAAQDRVPADTHEETRHRRSFEVPRPLLGKIDGVLAFASRVAGTDLPAGALWELIAAEYLSGVPAAAGRDDEAGAATNGTDATGMPASPFSPASTSALSGTAGVDAPTGAKGPRGRGTAEDPRGYQKILERDSRRWHWLPDDRPRLEPHGEWRELQRRLSATGPRSAWELHEDMTTALTAERRVAWQLGRLLVTIRNRRLWRDMLFASFAHYVRERLGFSVRTAERLIRVDREAWRYPPLRRAWEKGEVSVVVAEALLRVLRHVAHDTRAQQEWIDLAGRSTYAQVLALIRKAELEHAQALPGHRSHTPPMFVTCKYVVWMSDGEHEVLERALAAARARDPGGDRGETDAAACLEALLDEFLRSYAATARKMRRTYPLFERDGWRCRAPGCSAHGPLHLHHIVFRAHGGGDQPENLVTLCDFHHKALHSGWIRCVGRAPHALYWELGIDRAVGFGRAPIARVAGSRRLTEAEYWDGVRVRNA